MDGVKLTFDEDALDYIVDKAIEYKLGARGLRSLSETVMMDYMYEIPTEGVKELLITKEIANNRINRMEKKMLI